MHELVGMQKEWEEFWGNYIRIRPEDQSVSRAETIEFTDGGFPQISPAATKNDVTRIASKFSSFDVLTFAEAFNMEGIGINVLQTDVCFEIGRRGIDAFADAMGNLAERQSLPVRFVQVF